MALKRDWLNFVLPYAIWGVFTLIALVNVIYLVSKTGDLKEETVRVAEVMENHKASMRALESSLVADDQTMQKVDAYFQDVFGKPRYTEDILETLLAVARKTKISDIHFSTSDPGKKGAQGIAFSTSDKPAGPVDRLGSYEMTVSLRTEYPRIGQYLQLVSRLRLPVEVRSLNIRRSEKLCEANISLAIFYPEEKKGGKKP